MNQPAILLADQASAVRELSAAYGCALVTAAGVDVEAHDGLVNVELEDGTVATLRDPEIGTHPDVDAGMFRTFALVAKAHGGSIAFQSSVYAEVMCHDLLGAGVPCHVHVPDAPHDDYEAMVIFE